MAAQTCLSVLTPVTTKYFEMCFGDGWVDDNDGWMARWRERGTGCTTSCLDPLLPSSVHIERHSEGHGCLWKCLCELLPGRKNIWGASLCGIWRQQAEPNSIYYPPCFTLYTLCALVLDFQRQRFFIVWVESHHTPLFSETGGMCLHQPATFKQISLYVCKRWIQVSPSCCCGALCVVVQNCHKTDKKPRAK